MKIEKFGGTEKQLYQLLTPLIMKPSVLRQNDNYPFKTSVRHVWFVALEDEVVIGFIPVEIKDSCAVVNNYYIAGDDAKILTSILHEIINEFISKYTLQSIAHIRHLAVFQESGFIVSKEWKRYAKMVYNKKAKKV